MQSGACHETQLSVSCNIRLLVEPAMNAPFGLDNNEAAGSHRDQYDTASVGFDLQAAILQ